MYVQFDFKLCPRLNQSAFEVIFRSEMHSSGMVDFHSEVVSHKQFTRCYLNFPLMAH